MSAATPVLVPISTTVVTAPPPDHSPRYVPTSGRTPRGSIRLHPLPHFSGASSIRSAANAPGRTAPPLSSFLTNPLNSSPSRAPLSASVVVMDSAATSPPVPLLSLGGASQQASDAAESITVTTRHVDGAAKLARASRTPSERTSDETLPAGGIASPTAALSAGEQSLRALTTYRSLNRHPNSLPGSPAGSPAATAAQFWPSAGAEQPPRVPPPYAAPSPSAALLGALTVAIDSAPVYAQPPAPPAAADPEASASGTAAPKASVSGTAPAFTPGKGSHRKAASILGGIPHNVVTQAPSSTLTKLGNCLSSCCRAVLNFCCCCCRRKERVQRAAIGNPQPHPEQQADQLPLQHPQAQPQALQPAPQQQPQPPVQANDAEDPRELAAAAGGYANFFSPKVPTTRLVVSNAKDTKRHLTEHLPDPVITQLKLILGDDLKTWPVTIFGIQNEADASFSVRLVYDAHEGLFIVMRNPSNWNEQEFYKNKLKLDVPTINSAPNS